MPSHGCILCPTCRSGCSICGHCACVRPAPVAYSADSGLAPVAVAPYRPREFLVGEPLIDVLKVLVPTLYTATELASFAEDALVDGGYDVPQRPETD